MFELFENRFFKFLVIIIIIIVLIGVGVSLRNNGDDGGQKTPPEGTGKRWEDLYHFKEFLYNNYTVIEKSSLSTAVLRDIEDPEDAVWLIAGVEKEFTSEEASAVKNFVKNGGNLILASESTYANKISLQFAVEFLNHRIIETEDYDENENFIPINAYLAGTTYSVLTNGPIGLKFNSSLKTTNVIEIASSSEYLKVGYFSFIDLNDNGEADAEDIMGPIPIAIEVQIESYKGSMIFISDSGLFTDDLWDRAPLNSRYENNIFCKALLKYTVSRQGTVIYDFSKHENIQSPHLLYPL